MLSHARNSIAGLILLGWLTGCSPPPAPSAETAALEEYLLDVAEIGNGFTAQERGEVGVSGGMVCPESEFSTEDVGMVRAAFSRPSAEDGIHGIQELYEQVWASSEGELVDLFADMAIAFQACDGVVWHDYGDDRVQEMMEGPPIGDDRVAVRRLTGAGPDFDGMRTESRTMFVRLGGLFVEVTIAEEILVRAGAPVMSDEEFFRIVTVAIDKLPG